jgi:hypothetical protein
LLFPQLRCKRAGVMSINSDVTIVHAKHAECSLILGKAIHGNPYPLASPMYSGCKTQIAQLTSRFRIGLRGQTGEHPSDGGWVGRSFTRC